MSPGVVVGKILLFRHSTRCAGCRNLSSKETGKEVNGLSMRPPVLPFVKRLLGPSKSKQLHDFGERVLHCSDGPEVWLFLITNLPMTYPEEFGRHE